METVKDHLPAHRSCYYQGSRRTAALSGTASVSTAPMVGRGPATEPGRLDRLTFLPQPLLEVVSGRDNVVHAVNSSSLQCGSELRRQPGKGDQDDA